jgi:hypothetical protein
LLAFAALVPSVETNPVEGIAQAQSSVIEIRRVSDRHTPDASEEHFT